MSESMDIKRFVLISRKRIWKIFAAAAVCAVACAVVYLLATYVFAGSFPYRCSAFYYIDFDQRTAKETQLYYNDFTWNDVIDSDMIAGRASQICGEAKKEIAEATSIPTSTDIRMIRVYVDMPDAETAEKVQKALGEALAAFAAEAEGFEAIRQWDYEGAALLKPENHCFRWTVFGVVCGLIAGFLLLMYDAAKDDGLYIEYDVKRFCGRTAAAVLFKDGSEDKERIREFFGKLLKTAGSVALSCFEKEDAARVSKVKELIPADCSVNDAADTVLLIAGWGEHGRRLRQYADELELLGKKALIVIADADRKFFRKYYEV